MVQAAMSNVVDFSTAQLLDRRWWLKIKLLLDALENRNVVDVIKLHQLHNLAVLNYSLDKTAFDHHWTGSNDAIKKIQDIIFPWLNDNKLSADSNRNRDIMSAWAAKYGDIKDPAVRAKYDKMASDIRKHRERRKEKAKKKETTKDKLRRVVGSRKKRAK